MKSEKNIHLLLVKSILFLSFYTTGIFYSLQAQTTYFVSLNGNDKNNGLEKAPFKSIKAAQDKARGQKGEVTIYLRSGEYRLDKTLIFTPQDGNKDKRLTLSSYPGEQAVICGGVQLKLKWQPYKNGIMQAKVTPKISIDMLTDNGKISHMARYPNFDSLAVRFNGTSADATSPDRVKTWKNPSGGYLHAMHVSDWGDFHYRITGKDEKGILKLEGGWQNNRPYGLSPDNRMVENIFEELDAPGEWYYDTNEAILYYYPLPNEDIAYSVFEVARLKHLVEFRGTEQEPVKNITIKNIEFTQTARTFMERYEPLLRSDWTIYRGGAIVFEGTESCNLNGCYLHNLGGNAVFFSSYNRNSGISGSTITQIGASAICFVGDSNAVRSSSFNYHNFTPLEQMDREPGPKTKNYPANCLVYDNLIHTIGLFEKQITGVELSMCRSITVSHNSIYDVPRAGINVSEGTWGGHIIEYNDVFETVKETGDHGSFNSWGRDRFWHPNRDEMNRIITNEPSLILADAISTTIIRNNRFRCDRGWDIDLDDGSGNYHIYNNLCLNGGIKLREGFYRVVENNILVNNTFHPHVWFENSGDVFSHNIVMEPYQPINLPVWGAMVDYNIFTDSIALADAQNRGTDKHSILYPVEFQDPVSGDFRVKNTASSVFRLGFQNFDMDCFGVISPWLKRLAKTPRITLPIVKASDAFSNIVECQGWHIKNLETMGERSASCLIELAENWRLMSSKDVQAGGTVISVASYPDNHWYPIRRMPATVLEILQEDGVYPDLYVGKNLLEKVPQDLYKQDWWYRTTFKAPVSDFYTLEFPGINYRAEIWLNGEKIADNKQVAGMYVAHEFDVTPWIKKGSENVLAVKVTPEQKIQNVNGVELADSWFDWINWKYLGYNARPDDPGYGSITSFVPDRNAGIWKPVYLRGTGSVSVRHAFVNSELSLSDSVARLTVFTNLHNLSTQPMSGILKGTISRKGKASIYIKQSIILSPNEDREIVFAPEKYPELIVKKPDLWWPYTMGTPALYNLHFDFVQDNILSDSSHIRFGIRSITQHRDNNEKFPQMEGGNFYLKVNGRDFLVRGGNYTPDLLFRYDPEREEDILRYVKDLGINFLRWESKISSEHIIELADEQGIPIMFGWMCCNQWEKWDQWDDECHCVASQSLHSQIQMLRHHPSVFVWANASDGIPPDPISEGYNKILSELHWQNAVVNTVSAFAKDSAGNRIWDGIRMEGPYCWRPPSYWFGGKYPATCGATVEQGDNEQIPTLESLRKFIPEDKLWPINDTWYMHAGAWPANCSLGNIQLALEKRYGPSSNIEDFVRKAQLAHYENARAQFESFAACGWASHKMTVYWMLNSHWPSFYGNLIDYYMSPGGVYYGAKKGLQPLSVVFDSYATGDNSQARIIVFNQTPNDVHGLNVRVRLYDLDGKVRDDRSVKDISVSFNDTNQVMLLPRYPESSPVFFVRCQLFDKSGKPVVDNTYWKSQKDDDVGPQKNDYYTSLQQEKWSDMTALNTMPVVKLEIETQQKKIGEESHVAIRIHNPSAHIGFFERVTVSETKDGNEILPIEYTDNYVTVFPGETIEIHGTIRKNSAAKWVRVEGYNTPVISVPIK